MLCYSNFQEIYRMYSQTSPPQQTMELPDEDTIRVLITSDNHVGYNENDPITGDDSWKTFHEVMMIAKNYQVDMVLQSGDLFHVNKPTKKSLYQVMKTLRLACMGDKPCELELLNDPAMVFSHNEFTNVNYEDPNYNISIPVFGISGNHDDATGDSLLCPMDLLHVSGLVNHFGKVLETDNIKLLPLLFQKGRTKLALYGMQSIREERLFRTFKEGAVTFEVPTVRDGEWFNLMCVHQNHTGHTNTAFLPEQFLPDFLDMVVWGHEHECVPHLVYNPTKQFNVLQPGSSVATSLCDAEAKPKYVFILEVRYDNMKQPKLTPVPLTTIRTFQMRNISLRDIEYLKPHDKDGIIKYLIQQVEEMIEQANEETRKKLNDDQYRDEDEMNKTNDDKDDNLLSQLPTPLIRLRVDYSGPMTNGNDNVDYQVENPRRFSNRFVGRVANSNNIIQFYKKKRSSTGNSTRKRIDKNITDALNMENNIDNDENMNNGELQIESLITDLLNKMQLSLLPEVGLNEAVKTFVDKDEKTALKEFIDKEINNEVEILVSSKQFLESENPEDVKLLIKEVKRANSASAQPIGATPSADNNNSNNTSTPDINTSTREDIVASKTKSNPAKRNRSITRGKPASTSNSRRKKPSTSDSIVISSSEDEDMDYHQEESAANANADDDDIVTLSSDEGDMEGDTAGNRRRSSHTRTTTSKPTRVGARTAAMATNSRRKTTATSASASGTKSARKSKSGSTRTPKTDILESFLARKRG